MSADPQRPTVVFDIIGTLFTLQAPRDRLAALGAPAHALDLWFAQTLRDAFAWSHAGGYRPLNEVLEAALDRALFGFGIDATDQQRAEILAAFGELDPVSGAGEAVSLFSDAGWRIMALTNAGEQATRALLSRAGFEDRFSALLSCDRVQRTKPHPAVYEMARQEAGHGVLWLVAGHAWDVAGAMRAGLRGCWVPHAEKRFLAAYPPPDLRAESLPGAARSIIESQESDPRAEP